MNQTGEVTFGYKHDFHLNAKQNEPDKFLNANFSYEIFSASQPCLPCQPISSLKVMSRFSLPAPSYDDSALIKSFILCLRKPLS
jgi:hypothetical protein